MCEAHSTRWYKRHLYEAGMIEMYIICMALRCTRITNHFIWHVCISYAFAVEHKCGVHTMLCNVSDFWTHCQATNYYRCNFWFFFDLLHSKTLLKVLTKSNVQLIRKVEIRCNSSVTLNPKLVFSVSLNSELNSWVTSG